MKKHITILAVLILVLGTGIAQTHTYCPGDSVYLGLATYRGNLQWQQSTDSLNWTNISGATFSPYGFKFTGNNYYRAMITDGNCNPVYSPVQRVINSSNCQPQYLAGSVFCNGPTLVVEVINPGTGKTWMDRNLGALQTATSISDSLSYGDMYQWGRGNDGHQCRNSATTTTLSSTDQPSNGDFILNPNYPHNWRNPQNINLWQGTNGVNNPCPSGFRIPTEAELDLERQSWNTNDCLGAYSSPLKLPSGGYRNFIGGGLNDLGITGQYWSSTLNTPYSRNLFFDAGFAFGSIQDDFRSLGISVRCIKN
jgi:hypothetical protein